MKSLRKQDEISVFIVAIDVDKYAPGLYLADTQCISPPISNKKKYLFFLYEIINKHSINIIYPCYSKEITFFSENIKKFNRKGVKLLLPTIETIKLCNNKLKITSFVEKLCIPIPKIMSRTYSLSIIPET